MFYVKMIEFSNFAGISLQSRGGYTSWFLCKLTHCDFCSLFLFKREKWQDACKKGDYRTHLGSGMFCNMTCTNKWIKKTSRYAVLYCIVYTIFTGNIRIRIRNIGLHSCAVVSTVTSQQEGSWVGSWQRPPCVWFLSRCSGFLILPKTCILG